MKVLNKDILFWKIAYFAKGGTLNYRYTNYSNSLRGDYFVYLN